MREEFEKWISSPPFERSVDRYPEDAEKFAWPGNYKDLDVDLAWFTWQAAIEHAKKTMCNRN